ncbi:MAG: 30S ribosome-binding factor RbfA [Armatimonadetes bacterium]|nr:30S ribosome-binding factor RbfA [Armatimonadota bacterium]
MTTRQERLQELLREEMSDILRREFKDPRLGFITVTGAEITADLRHAKVFVSIMGPDEEKAQNMMVLKKAEHFARQALGRRVKMKILPEIEFRLDTSVDHSVRVLELLEQIRRDEEDKGT